MENLNVLNLRHTLSQYGVIMSFTGPFSQGIIEEIGEALRDYLAGQNNSSGDVFKVFSVFIEQTQNIKNYAVACGTPEEKQKILLSGIMNIGIKEGKYFVSSGNLVKNEDVEILQNKLEEINSLDKKGLAKAYRERLREDNDGNGAGLGFYEMARKAGEKFQFSFVRMDNEYHFFTLTILL